MKQKIKSISSYFLLVCFLSILFSCELEKEYFGSADSSYRIKRISFEQLKSRKEVFSKFEKASRVRQNSQMERIVYNEEYDLYFDIDNILYIEKEGYESYTIPLLKEPNDSLVKNLVLYHKLDEPIKAKLMGYMLTDDEIQRIKSGEIVDVSGKTYSSVLSSDYTVNGSVSWYDDSGCLVTATTTFIPGTPCIQDGHVFGEPCSLTGSGRATPNRLVIQYTYGFCLDGSVNGGTIGNPTSPTDPGGGGPGDGTSGQTPIENPPSNDEEEEEVVTTPVIPGLDEEIDVEEDPCTTLKNVVDPTKGDLKSDIDWLKTKVDEETEFGVEIEMRRINGEFSFPTDRKENGTANNVELNHGGFIVGSAHNHTKNAVRIPSFGDLEWIKICRDSVRTGRENQVFSIVVTKGNNGTTNVYAIKINNFQNLINELNLIWNSQKYSSIINERDKLDAILEDDKFYYNYNQDSTQDDVEKKFLQKYGGFGIDLYKATSDDLTQWSRLDLGSNPDTTSPNTLIVIPTPCN